MEQPPNLYYRSALIKRLLLCGCSTKRQPTLAENWYHFYPLLGKKKSPWLSPCQRHDFHPEPFSLEVLTFKSNVLCLVELSSHACTLIAEEFGNWFSWFLPNESRTHKAGISQKSQGGLKSCCTARRHCNCLFQSTLLPTQGQHTPPTKVKLNINYNKILCLTQFRVPRWKFKQLLCLKWV